MTAPVQQSTLVPVNPEAPSRDRRHQQVVAMILNALIRGGVLVQQGEQWGLDLRALGISPGLPGSGRQGPPGSAGSRFLTGAAEQPPQGLGNAGDVYLGTGSSNLYQKIQQGLFDYPHWQLLVNLRGQPGSTGLPGTAGPPGPAGSGAGAAAVASVSNNDGTLTISPTTGSVIASLNLAHANTWTALQTFAVPPTSPALGTSNEAWGAGALASGTPGSFNVAVGAGAMAGATGSNSVGIGYLALLSDTGGTNTALGFVALANNTSGAGNVAIGYSAMLNNLTGGNNLAIGTNALSANTSGGNNVAIGSTALANNATGTQNLGVGFEALAFVTGNGHVAIGSMALLSATTGTGNTALGTGTDVAVAGQDHGTALGYQAICQANELALSPYTDFQTFYVYSSSSALRPRADFTLVNVDNTDATRKYRLVVSAWDTAAREVLRAEATGTVGALGFFGSTAVVQQTASGVTAGFTAHASANASFNESTWTGNIGSSAYTISDIVAALKNYGLLAS